MNNYVIFNLQYFFYLISKFKQGDIFFLLISLLRKCREMDQQFFNCLLLNFSFEYYFIFALSNPIEISLKGRLSQHFSFNFTFFTLGFIELKLSDLFKVLMVYMYACICTVGQKGKKKNNKKHLYLQIII